MLASCAIVRIIQAYPGIKLALGTALEEPGTKRQHLTLCLMLKAAKSFFNEEAYNTNCGPAIHTLMLDIGESSAHLDRRSLLVDWNSIEINSVKYRLGYPLVNSCDSFPSHGCIRNAYNPFYTVNQDNSSEPLVQVLQCYDKAGHRSFLLTSNSMLSSCRMEHTGRKNCN